MMIGFSDGSPSQHQRIHELLLTHYPLQEDEWDFKCSAVHERALIAGQHPSHHEKWKQYLQSVKARVKGVLHVSPASFTILLPALEGVFTLKREKMGKVVYKRKFRIFLSLIGGFYTMFGQDEVVIDLDNQPEKSGERVAFDPVLYPTPYDIYERWFYLIRETITVSYPGYEFVPYDTLRYRMKDISTGYNGREGTAQSLFQALFSAEDINFYQIKADHRIHPFDRVEFN